MTTAEIPERSQALHADEIAETLPSFNELALLDDIAYDQVRKGHAEKLGIRVSTLDRQVYSRRAEKLHEADDAFPPPELWPEEVVLKDLLDEIVAAVQRHVIVDRSAAIAIALYVILTYCVDAIDCCPILGIESPEKRCGKTTLLDLLTRLVYRPTPAANISTATIYRLIEAIRPTFLLDEVDTFLSAIPDMVGILNSGHQRATAFVWRTEAVGDEWKPEKFSTWAPKIIAQIGKLPDTLRDRSILIQMRRKSPNEKAERLRKRNYSHIPRQAYTWSLANMSRILSVEPEIPDSLNDREADSWEPLLAIAELAGRDWPQRARSAAIRLAEKTSESDSIRIQLLADIRILLEAADGPGLCTTDLLVRLCELEDHPWPTYSRDKPINARQLANLLRPFGIKPEVQHKLGQKRGYMKEDFQDTFARYLPLEPAVVPLDVTNINEIDDPSSVTSGNRTTDKKPPRALVYKKSNGITPDLPGVPETQIDRDSTPYIKQGDDSWML